MTSLTILLLGSLMVATAFLSGLFGMAGGMILIGVLLALLPVPAAMVLHAVTQMASNGWRAVLWRRHVVWRTVAAYVCGCAIAFAVWSVWRYVPSKPVTYVFLGLTPFAARLIPIERRPDPEKPLHGVACGLSCMTLMLLTGVAGPLIDTFFLGGRMDRRQLIATKAVCQVVGHGVKLVYFGGIVAGAASIDPLLAAMAIAASMLGTTLSRRFLEMMTDAQFRIWAGRLLTVMASYYLVYGVYLFATASATAEAAG